VTGGDNNQDIPAAVVRRRKGPSAIWIVPIIAALVGAWLWVEEVANKGPTIQVTFANAEGLEAGKTAVKFKDLKIGQVDSIVLNEDGTAVIVTATLVKPMAPHLGPESLFWVVRPRVDADGISGLTTLLSGAFIAIEPIDPKDGAAPLGFAPTLQFAGEDIPPADSSDLPGLNLLLHSDELSSISEGAPLFYRGLEAGLVTGIALSADGQSVEIGVWIKQPFVAYTYSNTRFWLKPLIDFSATAGGVDFSLGSLRTLITGGIAFGLGPENDPGAAVVVGENFLLYKSEKASVHELTNTTSYVMYFDESVHSLGVGAPVEFNGIAIGRVTSIHLDYDGQQDEFFVPVVVEIESRRIEREGSASSPGTGGMGGMAGLLAKGLHARMETGSLLTGAKYIDLVLLPESPAVFKGYQEEITELPTVTTLFGSMLDNVNQVLADFDITDIKQEARDVMKSIQLTSDSLRQQVDSAQIGEIKDGLVSLVENLTALSEKVDNAIDPAFARVDDLAERGEDVLSAVDTLIAEVSLLTADDSRLVWLVGETLQELSASARSLRVLTDYLERHPEALLQGKAGGGGN
jgi:paraquat-inducible protein B